MKHVKYSSLNNNLPFTYERVTSASIEPSLTQYELANALLPPSEVLASVKTRKRMFIKGRNVPLPMTKQSIEDFLSVIRPECLRNGDIEFRNDTSFTWVVAHSAILRRYGISHLGLKGVRDKITGVVIGSIVSYDNDEMHIKRYANIVRAIKQVFPKHQVKYETCFSTRACDIEIEKKLKEWIGEQNSQQPERNEDD